MRKWLADSQIFDVTQRFRQCSSPEPEDLIAEGVQGLDYWAVTLHITGKGSSRSAVMSRNVVCSREYAAVINVIR